MTWLVVRTVTFLLVLVAVIAAVTHSLAIGLVGAALIVVVGGAQALRAR